MMKNTLITLIILGTASICAGNNGWIQLSSMQTARNQFAGCVIGNEIFVFGGNDPTGYKLYSGEKYDIAIDTWSSVADNPHYENPWNDAWGVEELTGVALNGKFYVFGAYGGYNEYGHHGVFNYNQVYDPVADTWTTLAPKPTTTASSVAVAYGDKIYLFGGYFWDESLSDDGVWDFYDNIRSKVIEVYDPATDQWDSVGEMPKLISGMAIAIYETSAYIIGGVELDGEIKFNEEVMVYDFETGEWIENYSTAPPEAQRVYSYASGVPVVNGKVILVGGIQADDPSNSWSVELFSIFDIAPKTWDIGPALPEPRMSHLTVVSNNIVYVIGGEDDIGAKATVFTYSLIGSPDLDDNGTVDIGDLIVFAEQWLETGCDGPEWCEGADLNRDGTVDMQDFPIIAESWLEGIPNMTWVYIDDDGTGMKDIDGHPINEGGFSGYMSKYLTSNAQYAQYLNAALASGDIDIYDNGIVGANGSNHGEDFVGKGYYHLDGPGYSYAGATGGGASRISYINGTFVVNEGFEDHPVTWVSCSGATAFASYYGWRLPTEWEWQAVADYDGNYAYATGDSLYNNQKFLANYGANGSDDAGPNTLSYHPYVECGTTPVGYFGTFGYGLADMAGNVFEWTSSLYDDTSFRVIRGGSWYTSEHPCDVSVRRYGDPTSPYGFGAGFRVCR